MPNDSTRQKTLDLHLAIAKGLNIIPLSSNTWSIHATSEKNISSQTDVPAFLAAWIDGGDFPSRFQSVMYRPLKLSQHQVPL